MKQWLNVSRVFTPGAPINKYDLFSGRGDLIRDVAGAIHQRGRHVVLFGERGVGKTSLARILPETIGEEDFAWMRSVTINCDVSDDFSSLWRRTFREIVFSTEGSAGFGREPVQWSETLEHSLPREGEVTPDDIRACLELLSKPIVIVIDEIDRIRKPGTTALMADTIKTLSDHSTPATLILVGVADSVGELIAEHASIERALVQIRMPRMSRGELLGILNKGLGELAMDMIPPAQSRIAQLSQGLPQYTHSLGLYSSQQAVDKDRDLVSIEDVEVAVKVAVEKTQQSIRDTYHRAISSPRRESLYPQVLLACALAPSDILGYFSAAAIRAPMSRIMGRPYDIPAYTRHLNEFSEEARGPILQKAGTTRRFRFRFLNPLMQPFVIAHGLATDMLTTGLLDEMSVGQDFEGRGEPG